MLLNCIDNISSGTRAKICKTLIVELYYCLKKECLPIKTSKQTNSNRQIHWNHEFWIYCWATYFAFSLISCCSIPCSILPFSLLLHLIKNMYIYANICAYNHILVHQRNKYTDLYVSACMERKHIRTHHAHALLCMCARKCARVFIYWSIN